MCVLPRACTQLQSEAELMKCSLRHPHMQSVKCKVFEPIVCCSDIYRSILICARRRQGAVSVCNGPGNITKDITRNRL